MKLVRFQILDPGEFGKIWTEYPPSEDFGAQLADNRTLIFTVVYLVAWPLNENEAGGDLVLIEISLFF